MRVARIIRSISGIMEVGKWLGKAEVRVELCLCLFYLRVLVWRLDLMLILTIVSHLHAARFIRRPVPQRDPFRMSDLLPEGVGRRVSVASCTACLVLELQASAWRVPSHSWNRATLTEYIRRFWEYLTTLFQLQRSTVFKNRYYVFKYIIYIYI